MEDQHVFSLTMVGNDLSTTVHLHLATVTDKGKRTHVLREAIELPSQDRTGTIGEWARERLIEMIERM